MLQRLIDVLTTALRGLTDLPWGLHAIVAFVMVAGLVLWLVGERIIKPAVVVGCVGVGGLLGAIAVATTPLAGSASVWHGVGVGVFVGLLAGLLMYRSALALGAGVVFGMLLPLTAAGVLGTINPETRAALLKPERDQTGEAADVRTIAAASDELKERVASLVNPGHELDEVNAELDATKGAPSDSISAVMNRIKLGQTGSNADMLGLLAQMNAGRTMPVAAQVDDDDAKPAAVLPDEAKPAVERVRTFVTEAAGEARAVFAKLPAVHQLAIVLCAVIGLAGGVIVGMSMPRWAKGAVSSMFGAALWLPALVWLSVALAAPWAGQLDRPALHWLLVWAVVGVIGVAVQWSGVLGSAKKAAAPAPAPKPA